MENLEPGKPDTVAAATNAYLSSRTPPLSCNVTRRNSDSNILPPDFIPLRTRLSMRLPVVGSSHVRSNRSLVHLDLAAYDLISMGHTLQPKIANFQ